MLKRFCGWMLYSVMGWKKYVTVSHPTKYIICLAPHTSNWDFIIGQLYARAEGINSNFLMKKEWFFWPLGVFLKKIGGIPVTRSKHTSLTDSLADIAIRSEQFGLCVTPEGTRSYNPDWKRGFYFIAVKAGIPILLYGVDYEQKTITCTNAFVPTGNFDKDIVDIKKYFMNFKGKCPELFGY